METKIQIKVGIVEFSGEGNQDWLSNQLDKILEKIPELLKIELKDLSDESGTGKHTLENKKTKSKLSHLATFLKDKNATTNQNKKFLAVSAFLQLNGASRLNTGNIIQALKDSNQSMLSNASLNLTQNVTRGFCQKDRKDFYVTSEGFAELGINE